MSRYFYGEGSHMGEVYAVSQPDFRALVTEFLTPVLLRLTREEYHALPPKDKNAPLDQMRAKRGRYITPSVFRS